ncbi:DNA-binding MarR family transcriptional regulator [Gillisia mitskevichiae]|uniref:DNA-binding MarR family transcriptional regulator n=1 Tax=Gillisia mitskevichiae TaxID=270921 RepID=A0A495P3V5_9FLAO|nr:MarR family transcriptional regulator [Gillisia mitskevichiae]RKS43359.1 DNA-binding MarR family transcriptional regulator [Gillisia mitskevichiae]
MKIEELLKTDQTLPPSRKLLLSILHTTNLINDKISETLKPFDISISQFNVLRILRGQKGKPANLSTIQERMISKMSNTTRLVDKLIVKEYVERSICQMNRRKVEINITSKGLEVLKVIDPLIDKTEELITNQLSPSEVESITTNLQKLLK